MKNQLKGICLLLFALVLLLFNFSVQGLWLPILGSVDWLAEYGALACGIGGVYLAFRGDK